MGRHAVPHLSRRYESRARQHRSHCGFGSGCDHVMYCSVCVGPHERRHVRTCNGPVDAWSCGTHCLRLVMLNDTYVGVFVCPDCLYCNRMSTKIHEVPPRVCLLGVLVVVVQCHCV
eukprot:PhF_6_TR13418/c0_g1_i3/m.21379